MGRRYVANNIFSSFANEALGSYMLNNIRGVTALQQQTFNLFYSVPKI